MSRLIIIISAAVFLMACGISPKTNFYVLNSSHSISQGQPSVGSPKADAGKGVGIWQVKLPSLLERSEIVTRNDQFKIELADFHKWAGGLGTNMTRLVASELSRNLKSNRISIFPWKSYVKNDYQLMIHVTRFDGVLGGNVILEGVWILLNSKGNKELTRESYTLSTKASGESYNDMVAALSELTVTLSKKISETIASQK